jgi:copper resistance protein B
MIVDNRAFYREPEAALSFYSKDDPSRQIGSGLSDLDTGVRLRYEISRKVAPYIGLPTPGSMATRPAIRVRQEKPQATTVSYSGFDCGSENRAPYYVVRVNWRHTEITCR